MQLESKPYTHRLSKKSKMSVRECLDWLEPRKKVFVVEHPDSKNALKKRNGCVIEDNN